MQRITYETKHGTLGSGFVADMAESPLTGSIRILVVDSVRDASDPDAGIWISAADVVDDGQPKPQWLYSPAN